MLPPTTLLSTKEGNVFSSPGDKGYSVVCGPRFSPVGREGYPCPGS